jgi:GT2 family glycosyltransferase
MTTRNHQWTIVTVTFNSGKHLQQHWANWRAHAGDARWIVVDNASSDQSREIASSLGADVIGLSTNLGFSVANNVGLDACETNYIAFVNPDVSFQDTDAFDALARVIERRNCLVAPQLINPDGTPQLNGRGVPFLADKFAHRGITTRRARLDLYLPKTYSRSDEVPVAWTMGAALAGRRADVIRLGGWDERYFIYYEDHDIGIRAWEAGLGVYVCPQVQFVHTWQRDTTRMKWQPWRHEIQSAWQFYRRYPYLLRSANRAMIDELNRGLAEYRSAFIRSEAEI